MKDKMSLNRNRDRDITAHQPLLDNDRNNPNQNQPNHHNISSSNTNTNTNSNEYHLHPHNDRTYLVECPSALNGNSLINSGSQAVANTIAGTMSAAAAAASRHSGTKYSKLENALDSPSHYGQPHQASSLDSPGHRYVGETVSIQQRMIQGQDEQLDMISDSIGTLKTVSRQIGVELDEQAVMLDDFGNEFDTTESKLDTTMKKVAKVLHMNNDKRQWAAILILTGLLLFVIILFIIL
ncbi:syntaxin-6 isoform X2 [Drosophila subobscura]|nr:syntaxin-6 isoform X2 [Drosophila subobscura]